MAVGQIVGGRRWVFPLGVAQGYVVYGRWPIVGERQRVRGLTFGGPFFHESVVGRYRGKRGDDGQECRREQNVVRAFLLGPIH